MDDRPPLVPADLRYTRDHMWVRSEGACVRIGVTDVAQRALGEVVFVDLPAAGQTVEAGREFAWLESSKAVVDLFPPVPGLVREANTALLDAPRPLNDDPYGTGWLCVIEPGDPAAAQSLMEADAYLKLVEDS